MGRAYCAYFTNSVRKEGDAMRRIAINMQNTLFCNAIADTLRRSGNELEPYTIDSPDKVVDECKWITPFALLMEVTGYTPWLLAERMKIRDAVKELNIGCKIVLIVASIIALFWCNCNIDFYNNMRKIQKQSKKLLTTFSKIIYT